MRKTTHTLLITALLTAVLVLCGACGQPPQGSVTTMGVVEFLEVIEQKNVRLIDVRTPEEYAKFHLDGAENIDVRAADFDERIEDVKGKVAVYCRSGGRSLIAADKLAAQGCTVYNLKGGIRAWQDYYIHKEIMESVGWQK